MSATPKVAEEGYVLRVEDPEMAKQLKDLLREQVEGDKIDIMFKSDQEGIFKFGNRKLPFSVRSLPCVTELWKTFDDENLVKSLDVGQLITVRSEDAPKPPPGESRDGIAPVMSDARNRHFRKLPDVNPVVMERVESDLIDIVNQGAPKGWTFEDIEEEYVEDPQGGEGSWKIISRNDFS